MAAAKRPRACTTFVDATSINSACMDLSSGQLNEPQLNETVPSLVSLNSTTLQYFCSVLCCQDEFS